MESKFMKEEFDMPSHVQYVTGLPFGHGKIGAANRLITPEDTAEFVAALDSCTVPLTNANTADCVDERRTIALADGTNDPSVLANRVVAQMPGGLVLASTKAAVGANLAILRDAKDFQSAYLTMYDVLKSLGFEDGGHQGCGASALVEASVADEVGDEPLLATLPALTVVDGHTAQLINENRKAKHMRLESGFYGTWTKGWHEAFLADKVPHNFSILADDPDDHETHGHHASGIYLIHSEHLGFAKNKFIDATGKESFAATLGATDALARVIISRVGGSDEERARLRLEFGIDAPQVLNQLVVKDIPVFAEAA